MVKQFVDVAEPEMLISKWGWIEVPSGLNSSNSARCRVLDLEECRGIGADSLGYALTGLPKLRVLNLSGNREVSDALLSEAALAVPLREVSLCR